MGLFSDFIDIANEFKDVGELIKKEFTDLGSDVTGTVRDIRDETKQTASDISKGLQGDATQNDGTTEDSSVSSDE